MRRSTALGLVVAMAVLGSGGASAQEAAGTAPADSEPAFQPASIAVERPPGTPIVADPDTGVVVILDTSGSMKTKHKVTGVPRIEAAKKALRELINKGLADGAHLGIRTYVGTRDEPCRHAQLVEPGPLDRKAAVARLGELWPTKGGRSPIAYSILMAGDDLRPWGKKIVVLISDGDDTCDGDPAETIDLLYRAGHEIQLDIIGFEIKDKSVKKKMRSWAASTGGSYHDISDADELLDALKQAFRPGFTASSLDHAIEYAGIVGGPPIEVPPGNYVVDVPGETYYTSEPFELEAGDQLVHVAPA